MRKYRVSLILVSVVLLLPYILFGISSNWSFTKNFPKSENKIGSYIDQVDSYLKNNKPFSIQISNLIAKIDYKFLLESENKILFGENGWIFYNSDDILENMKGIIPINNKIDSIGKKMDNISKWGSANDIEIVFMVGPNKESVYFDYIKGFDESYADFNTYSSNKLIELIVDKYKVKLFSPIENLRLQKKPLSLYYKTDTHWNELGGFVATQSLLNKLGFNSQSSMLFDYKIEQIGTKKGDLANIGRLGDVLEEDEVPRIMDYKSEVITSEIGVPISGQFLKHQVFKSSNGNENILMIGDSFITGMLPSLVKNFNTTTVIHRDDFERKHFEDSKPDVIVISVVERYFISSLESGLDRIINKLSID